MPIHLHVVYGCLHGTTAEVNSCDSQYNLQSLKPLALFRKSLPIPDIDSPWKNAQGIANSGYLCQADLRGRVGDSPFSLSIPFGAL